MRLILLRLLFAAVALASATAHAQPTARILLVGDSWSDFQWQDRVFREALSARGLADVEEQGALTALGGTTAAQWASPEFLALIDQSFQAQPSLDMVHLSIGGNDFLRANPANLIETLQLFLQILADITTVVEHIHAIDPDIRVVYSMYDYVNTGTGFGTELALFNVAIKALAARTRNLYLVNNLGVLHHRFGFGSAFGPGERPLPGGFPRYQPLSGGDPSFPGDPALFRDAIHPTSEGYLALAQHSVDEFFLAWLGPQAEVRVSALGDPVVDPAANELVAVTLFTTNDVDAASIDPTTLAFGPNGATPVAWLPRGLVLDLDGDGRRDRLLLFRTGRSGLIGGDDTACLQFDRGNGLAAQGCDGIVTPAP